MATFGKRLSQARKSLGLSQVDFSKSIGVSRAQLYLWENDKNLPSGENIFKLADALGVNAVWLLGGEGPQKGTDGREWERLAEGEARRAKIAQDFADRRYNSKMRRLLKRYSNLPKDLQSAAETGFKATLDALDAAKKTARASKKAPSNNQNPPKKSS